ncbi:hypothetical protein Axi01nite_76300 [Actinoplanes xinjiangensis]|nr:hypothetical protein Axi01nite_76300 [Actinoplanes xinjiangensis]
MPISALRTNPITRLTRLPTAMIALWPAVLPLLLLWPGCSGPVSSTETTVTPS